MLSYKLTFSNTLGNILGDTLSNTLSNKISNKKYLESINFQNEQIRKADILFNNYDIIIKSNEMNFDDSIDYLNQLTEEDVGEHSPLYIKLI